MTKRELNELADLVFADMLKGATFQQACSHIAPPLSKRELIRLDEKVLELEMELNGIGVESHNE